MAESEMFKTTFMGGYDKEEVREQIQKLKDELAEQQVLYRRQLSEKEEQIAELQKRLELKEASQAKLEADIRDKYQKYIDNYESIGKLVFEAQVKAETMESEAQKKCADMVEKAEEEAKRRAQSVQTEIDEKLLEGKRRYTAIQEEMNRLMEMINQMQKRFMASFKEVHQIISSVPEAFNDLEDEMELDISYFEEEKKEEAEKGECHLGDTQELDIMDTAEDLARLEEFEEEKDEDSEIALQISRLLSEEDEAMLEEERREQPKIEG